MKKTNLMKAVSILLISAMVILFNVNVFAADNTGFNDLTSTLTNSSNSGANNTNSSSNNTSSNTNSSSNSSLSTNSITSNNSNTNRINTSSNSNVNSNNSSIYNTNLPKTGVESSVPVAMFIIILSVSAIYAYRKIKEYKNI